MSRSLLAASVGQLRSRLAAQRTANDSDERLLHAFLAHRENNAFAHLVRRYGPLVLRVCRRVLGHEQDAEDAFQATFLVLAQNAPSLRNKTALAGFLHGTAYRIALKARQAAARRRKYEEQAPTRSYIDPADELSWREIRMIVDEEVARLPEKYRSAFILCCLESLSQTDAAQRLGLKEGTLSSRLTAARKLLAQRLARRGVQLTAVLAATSLATQPASALSPLLIAATLKAARTVGEAMTAVVSAEVVALAQSAPSMLVLTRAKIALAAMLATCTLAVAGTWTFRTSAAPQAERPAETPKPAASSKPRRDNNKVVMVNGRVLLPDGKPAANATILRRRLREDFSGGEDSVLTTTGSDGRFEVEHQDSTILIAAAPGFAPDWTGGHDFQGGDITLTLAERATVRGKLISLEGKPIAGARVKVVSVKAPIGGNLTAVKDAFKLNPEWAGAAMPKALSQPIPGSPADAKTGVDGRFELEGFGKNRIVELRVEGDGIVSDKVQVILADDFDPKSIVRRPNERTNSFSPSYHPTVYGPRFTHAVRPCQVITGVITDEATGKPIPGIKVVGTAGSIRIFDSSAWSDAVEAITDKDGGYRLHGLAKTKQRHLHIQAGAAPYLDRLLDVAGDSPTFDPARMDIKLHKAVVIEGRLIDKATGKGVRGEVLFLLLENDDVRRFLVDNPVYSHEQSVRPSGMHAHSDAEGRFKLHVPPVPLVILARAGDAAGRYTPINVGEADRKYLRKPPKEVDTARMLRQRGAKDEIFDTHMLQYPLHWMNGYALVDPKKSQETVKVVIPFDPGRTLHGKIVGPDGRPLTGVQATGVQATGERGPETFRTDAFTVRALDPNRPRTVYFWHASKKLVGTITLRGDETELPIVQMQPAAAVVGRVLDTEGKPLASMEVSIQFSETEPDERIRQKLFSSRKLGTTDADGRFRLEGLFADLEFSVFAGRPGHRSIAICYEGVTLKTGEVRDLGERREQKQR